MKFPHRIVSSIKAIGGIFTDNGGSYRHDTVYEMVIDDLGQPWRAVNGVLIRLGTPYGEVPNYKDPRTAFHTVANADTADEATGWYWVNSQTGEQVEERFDDDQDPLAQVAPDCRESWKHVTVQA